MSSNETLQYVTAPSDAEALPAQSREILDRVNRKVAGAESVEAIVDFLFDETRQICPCDRIGLAFLTDEGRRVVSHHVRAAYEPVLLDEGYAEDLRGSSLSRVIETGRPRIIPDLEAYGRAHPQSRSTRILLKEGVRSSLTAPLAVEGRNVALLFRSSREKGVYDDEQVRMHQAVAERLSQAVEKAWRIEQLEAANHAYMEMLSFVSHELRSPVSSIVMDAEVMLEGFLGQLEPPQQRKIEAMVNKSQYLLSLIEEYLNLARIESGTLEIRPRDNVSFFGEVVEPALDVVRPQIDARSMRLTRQVPIHMAPCECDPDLMRVVLVNLLGNAAKYGREGGEIRLSVSVEGGDLDVSVWNEGPGFPPAQRERLFRKFSRLDAPELNKRKGSGVGLYTVWRIVDLHGGKARADSQQGRWAEFGFRIPQPLPDVDASQPGPEDGPGIASDQSPERP